jgi:acetamidase/formamidase
MFCSLAVDMRVTQLVDGNKGIHAMLPKRYANGRPNASQRGLR